MNKTLGKFKQIQQMSEYIPYGNNRQGHKFSFQSKRPLINDIVSGNSKHKNTINGRSKTIDKTHGFSARNLSERMFLTNNNKFNDTIYNNSKWVKTVHFHPGKFVFYICLKRFRPFLRKIMKKHGHAV